MSFDINEPFVHNIKASDPNLDHIPREYYVRLYEPSDDTFLFMEALEDDLNTMRYVLPQNPMILEVGPGTGILSSYLTRLLSLSTKIILDESLSTTSPQEGQNNSIQFKLSGKVLTPCTIGLDVNPLAVEMSNLTYLKNNANDIHPLPSAIHSDLLQNLPCEFENKTNVLLFNPPYVPTYEHEVDNQNEDDMIMNAYAGGSKGRDVLDKLIPQITRLISSETNNNQPFIFYCVFLWPHNDITELNALLDDVMKKSTSTQLIAHIIKARQCGLEPLAILRFMTNETYQVLPNSFRAKYPIANEENLRLLLKPSFNPPIITQNEVKNSIESNPLTKQLFGNNSDDDDEDDDTGFSLF